MSRRLSFLFAAFLLAPLACTPPRALPTDFDPAKVVAEEPGIDLLVIAMGPESRPLGGRSSMGGAMLAVIPLVPYGSQAISPELVSRQTSKGTNFNDILRDTVVKDLTAAGVARAVVGEEMASAARADERATHRLELTVKEGIINRHVTYYGLSVFGVLLTTLGVPAAFGDAELVIDARLLDPAGTLVAEQSFEATADGIETLYTVGNIAGKMVDAYAKFSPDLRAFVREHTSA